MSWHFLQGLEVASWADASLDGAPDALLKLIRSPGAYYSPDNVTVCCPSFPSGTMCGHSTGAPGGTALTLFPAGSPANHSAPRLEAGTLPKTCGPKCSESCGKLLRASCSQRTSCVSQSNGLRMTYRRLDTTR